jgi:hypothetical protein
MKVKIKESVLRQIVEQETKTMLEEKNNRMANIVFAIGEAYASCKDYGTKKKLEEVFSMFEQELFIDNTPYKLKDLFSNKPGDLK